MTAHPHEEGVASQPTLVFDPPAGQWLIEPSAEAIRSGLLRLTPQDWTGGSGTAGILWKGVGDMVLIDSLGAGWFLNILWADGAESFLLNPLATRQDDIGIDPGDYVELPARYFSPFEQVWQAIAYWLQHQQPDPALVWTTENPFPDL